MHKFTITIEEECKCDLDRQLRLYANMDSIMSDLDDIKNKLRGIVRHGEGKLEPKAVQALYEEISELCRRGE